LKLPFHEPVIRSQWSGTTNQRRGRIELEGHDVTNPPMYQRARLGIGYARALGDPTLVCE
jgi:ABC-type lipopolysaccharide export system ATPase subunit